MFQDFNIWLIPDSQFATKIKNQIADNLVTINQEKFKRMLLKYEIRILSQRSK